MNRTVNCIIVDDEPVAREILESHLSRMDNITVVASCKNAMEAFRVVNSRSIDLIFLDISMPEISGLSFARSLTSNVKIIFTTAYREFAVDGFDLQAVDYLLKPVSYDRLLKAVTRYLTENGSLSATDRELENPDISDSFFVRSERKMVKVSFSEIEYIESISDYIRIHIKERKIITRETLSGIEQKLPQNNFVRIHRSFIVNLSAVDSFTNEYAEVGSDQLPISRGYRQNVIRRLLDSRK
ncbi:MAG: LytR/AlgR family response regulator transcription factor [Bacteroidales bacterium]